MAGLYVNGVEIGTVDGYRNADNNLWLPLEELQQKMGFSTVEQEAMIVFKTPIGRAELKNDQLWLCDNKSCLSAEQLWQLIKIKVTFDQSIFAFMFDVPWRPGSALYDEEQIRKVRATQTPDVAAPSGSLGFMRLRMDYDRDIGSNNDNWTNTLDSGGALGKGTWLLGLRHEDDDDVRLDRFFWDRTFENNVFRLGTNYINLGQLLNSYDYTGAQWAYSNLDISSYTDFETDLSFDSFLREDIDVQRDIVRSDGPSGGIAELRINDKVVARVRVSLEGQYAFRNIPVNTGTYQSVKVYLYERTLSDHPQVINLTRSTISQMLPGGELLLRGGAGESGNILYDDYGSPVDGDASNFFLTRFGVTDNLTLQGVFQQSGDEEQQRETMLGIRMGLGQHWAVAVDGADREGKKGWYSELEGQGEEWEFYSRSYWYEQGYRSNFDDDEYDNSLRTFYTIVPSLRIGVVGRYALDSSKEKTEFLKPGAYWNPLTRLSVSAIPNLDGDYRFEGRYYLTSKSKISATYENDLYNLAYDYNFFNGLFSQSGIDYDKKQDEETIYSRLSWYVDDNQYNYLQGGISYNGETGGYFISWNRIFTPGIELQLGYQDDYRSYASDYSENNERFFINLRIDLDFSGGRPVPTDNRRINFSRGGVAGYLQDQDGKRLGVEDVDIRINGRKLPQYQAGGAFHVGNLRPGIYELEIDEGKLPIEYVPVKRKYIVEVAQVAITTVNFEVRAEYGFAGQVLSKGKTPVANALLSILNAAGKEVAQANSGQFGYFRTDALVPGLYRVRIIKVGDQLLSEPFVEREVEIKNNYLFGQDLNL
jgi:hypothetical protein